MTAPYEGPYLIVQDSPPLRIPLRQEPESGLLLHARTDYTTFATEGEARGAIERDREAGAEFERIGTVAVMKVSVYEESRIPPKRERVRRKKPPRTHHGDEHGDID